MLPDLGRVQEGQERCSTTERRVCALQRDDGGLKAKGKALKLIKLSEACATQSRRPHSSVENSWAAAANSPLLSANSLVSMSLIGRPVLSIQHRVLALSQRRPLRKITMATQAGELEWPVARVRSTFVEFFQSKGHTPVLSSPVVPVNDPTLLFRSAGLHVGP
jgi:hypothetical protein